MEMFFPTDFFLSTVTSGRTINDWPWSGTVFAANINVTGENMTTTKTSAKILVQASEKIGFEINPYRTMHINTLQNQTLENNNATLRKNQLELYQS